MKKPLDSHLQLLQGESTTSPELHVVLHSLTAHSGPQEAINGTGSDFSGLLDPLKTSGLFLSGLVEPRPLFQRSENE